MKIEPTAIILCGATGRTGNAVAHALAIRDDVLLAACVAPSVASAPTRPLPRDVPAFASLADAVDAVGSDAVIVDLSHCESAIGHLGQALEHGMHVVLGVTGIAEAQLMQMGTRFESAGLGLLHVPNFAIGAVLAMRVAADLARHFPDVEIVELHHDGKRDAPSGTALHTARMIAAARPETVQQPLAGNDAARGELVEGVRVHALRLPGATAHQTVVFGAPGELLTIRHDAIDRSCYAAGVARAAQRVHRMRGLQTGLEQIL